MSTCSTFSTGVLPMPAALEFSLGSSLPAIPWADPPRGKRDCGVKRDRFGWSAMRGSPVRCGLGIATRKYKRRRCGASASFYSWTKNRGLGRVGRDPARIGPILESESDEKRILS
ncbi:unnamed protein product [Urochloa humidicola]